MKRPINFALINLWASAFYIFCLSTNPILAEEAKIADLEAAAIKIAPEATAINNNGLASLVLCKGNGIKRPERGDIVEIHFTCWNGKGRFLDSSLNRGKPIKVPLDGVIKGWSVGIGLMVEGEKRKIWIPASLAYGNNPSGGKPAGDLIYEIELLKIYPSTALPPPPANVDSPPKNAECSTSGVKWLVVETGTGKTAPDSAASVVFDYSVWTPAGELIDTTALRKKPVTYLVKALQPGLREGLMKMVKGERRILWVPSSVNPEAEPRISTGPTVPSGAFVIDIRLHEITPAP
jgi:FKBP-type peptidyl-prolyl cis-trans isomerase